MLNLIISKLNAFQSHTVQGTDFYRVEGDVEQAKLQLIDVHGVRFDRQFEGFFYGIDLIALLIEDENGPILAAGNL